MLKNFFTPTDDSRLAYLESLVEDEIDAQKAMINYRRYYDGEHEVSLTDRQLEYLKDAKFRLNQCPVVVESLVERLALSGFESILEEQPEGAEIAPGAGLVEFAAKIWEDNRLDAGQKELYRQAGIDQVTYLVLDIDEAGLITLNHNDAFTSGKAGGDNDGVKLHYAASRRRGKPLFATKRWAIQQGQDAGYRRYFYVYYPDRIERYYQDDREAGGGQYGETGWRRLVAQEGPLAGVWPQPWLDADGQPLGIPVVPFVNGRASELHEVLPLQRALNKALIDLVAAADQAGFGILFAAGWVPTSDGRAILMDGSGKITSGNKALKSEPGAIFYTENPEGTLERISGDPLASLIQVVDRHTLSIAQVSRTPITNFQLFGQIPSDSTQRQLETGLLAKVEDRHLVYGNAWEDVVLLAARIAAGAPLWQGGQIVGHGLPAYQGFGLAGRVSSLWQEAETRNEKEHLETLTLKKALGVPAEQLFLEMSYTAEQAARFALEAERRRVSTMEQFIGGNDGGDDSGRQAQTENGRPAAK